MPVHRERVDPVRTPDDLGLVHRRWLLPDDLARPVGLAQAARLWRGLLDLRVLDADQEVRLERLRLPADGAGPVSQDLPAIASPGSLLAGSLAASFVTQVVWTDEEDRRDPYAEEDGDGFRDYTLYAVESDRQLFLPLVPQQLLCGACGSASAQALPRFGEGALLGPLETCPQCSAARDPGRDKGLLRSGALFLLEELVCKVALSIELPRDPEVEELPDAQVSDLLRATLGSYDELADDGVPAAQ